MENKRNWSEILDKLYKWKKVDDEFEQALNRFVEGFAPNSDLEINDNCIQAYLDGLDNESELPELYEWVSYIIYEVDGFDQEIVQIRDDKERKYNFKKREDVIKFLENNYE